MSTQSAAVSRPTSRTWRPSSPLLAGRDLQAFEVVVICKLRPPESFRPNMQRDLVEPDLKQLFWRHNKDRLAGEAPAHLQPVKERQNLERLSKSHVIGEEDTRHSAEVRVC